MDWYEKSRLQLVGKIRALEDESVEGPGASLARWKRYKEVKTTLDRLACWKESCDPPTSSSSP